MDKQPTKRRGPMTWLASRTWRFWLATTLILPVLYVLSYGPVGRLGVAHNEPRWLAAVSDPLYAPLHWSFAEGPEWFTVALFRYYNWWMPPPPEKPQSELIHLDEYAISDIPSRSNCTTTIRRAGSR